MHESHQTRCSVLLPRRLAQRVPLIEAPENVAAGADNWGLARRIRALPGMGAHRTVLDDGATATDYFIGEAYVAKWPATGPQLFCHIDLEGISIPHLDPADRAEVVHKGWSSRADSDVVMYLPRDAIEMEIAWRIVLRAYQFLASRPAAPRKRRKLASELPKYASTAKYWM